MSNLRSEGLLAKPGGKSKSGMSFEIVDMNSDLNESFVSSSSLLPTHKLRSELFISALIKKNSISFQSTGAEKRIGEEDRC